MTSPRIVRFQFPLDNGAYGFPRGQERRIEPFVLACLHITGNRNTATMPVGVGAGSGTRAEVAYMARDRHFDDPARADYGNSAHRYVARDGSALDCIPPRFAAWNNGDVSRPNTDLRSVRRIVGLVARGSNANEAYFREYECTGYPGSLPLTKEQIEHVARQVARDSLTTGLAISRETVHLHADIDGIDRLNCPFPEASREQKVRSLVDRAKAIRATLDDAPPEPDPMPEPDPTPDPTAELRSRLAAAEGEANAQRERADGMLASLTVVAHAVAPWTGDDPA